MVSGMGKEPPPKKMPSHLTRSLRCDQRDWHHWATVLLSDSDVDQATCQTAQAVILQARSSPAGRCVHARHSALGAASDAATGWPLSPPYGMVVATAGRWATMVQGPQEGQWYGTRRGAHRPHSSGRSGGRGRGGLRLRRLGAGTESKRGGGSPNGWVYYLAQQR